MLNNKKNSIITQNKSLSAGLFIIICLVVCFYMTGRTESLFPQHNHRHMGDELLNDIGAPRMSLSARHSSAPLYSYGATI